MVGTPGERFNVPRLITYSAGSGGSAESAGLPAAGRPHAGQQRIPASSAVKASEPERPSEEMNSFPSVSDSRLPTTIRKILVVITEHPVLSGALGAILAALILAVPGSVQN